MSVEKKGRGMTEEQKAELDLALEKARAAQAIIETQEAHVNGY